MHRKYAKSRFLNYKGIVLLKFFSNPIPSSYPLIPIIVMDTLVDRYNSYLLQNFTNLALPKPGLNIKVVHSGEESAKIWHTRLSMHLPSRQVLISISMR